MNVISCAKEEGERGSTDCWGTLIWRLGSKLARDMFAPSKNESTPFVASSFSACSDDSITKDASQATLRSDRAELMICTSESSQTNLCSYGGFAGS